MSLALFLALLAAPPAPAAPPQRVYVGAYLTDVSDFDLKAGRFKADLMVWAKWLGGDAPPQITFENGEVESKEDLGAEHDGAWHSARWRVQGTFRGDFPVHAFPFDRQTLPVVFGLPEADGVLVPDLGASGMSPAFSITGWDYEPYFSARADTRVYSSDLGSISREGKSTRLNRVSFTVELRRPTGPYLYKFALPLSLILLMSLLALFLPAANIEVRSAMAVTALLSCIAFQYSQAQSLPDVSYLVAADGFFLGSYLFITATLVISVVSFLVRGDRPALAMWGDRLGILLLPFATLVGAVWLSSSASARGMIAAPVAAVSEPRPSQPVLRIGLGALESLNAGGLPTRRAETVVKGADGLSRPVMVDEAPAMTNALVRLLPGGGMRVRWRLKDNAKWSDGTAITSEDMAFSLETASNPLRTAVERVDLRTVDVTYSARRGDFLESFIIFPRVKAQPLLADGGRESMVRAILEPGNPAGGGWVLESFEKGVSASYKRNPHATPAPVFERIEAKVYTAPAEAANALLRGDIDLLSAVGPEAFALLEGKPAVRLLQQPGDMLYVLVPNLKEGPWAELKARRALMQCIDREGLQQSLAPVPSQVASSWRAGFTSAAVPRYAPADGKRALEELGLKGAVLPLHLMKIRNKTSAYALIAQQLTEDLTSCGIEVVPEEHQETVPLFNRRDFQGLLLTARDTGDPWRYLNVPYENAHYKVEEPLGPHFDAPMVEAVERYASSLYAERKTALEQRLMVLWAERLPMLPLVLSSRVAAVRTELIGPEYGEADSLFWNAADWRRKN